MKVLKSNNNNEVLFFDNQLDRAKQYFMPSNSMLLKEDFIGENYNSYVEQFKQYKSELTDCNDIDELAIVLNKYTDIFNTGDSYYIKEL